MTQKEFLEKWDEKTLSSLNVAVGEKTKRAYFSICFEENGQWHMGMVSERNELTILLSGDESTVFTRFDLLVTGLKQTMDDLEEM